MLAAEMFPDEVLYRDTPLAAKYPVIGLVHGLLKGYWFLSDVTACLFISAT